MGRMDLRAWMEGFYCIGEETSILLRWEGNQRDREKGKFEGEVPEIICLSHGWVRDQETENNVTHPEGMCKAQYKLWD